jgi:pyrroline-5-carboxylate reductase
MESTHITFIGGGNMARSLVGGLIADGVPPGRLSVAEPDAARRAALQRDFGIATDADNAVAAAQAGVVVLAVKPQVMQGAARSVASAVAAQGALAISIAAGIRTAELARWLGAGAAVVRAMPNTPALLGCGATVLYAGDEVAPAQRELAESILRAVGSVSWVQQEAQMDAVTALSGSGPAYFFLLIEAMADAAAELGLPAELARLLAVETALGAARMALESDDPVDALRRRVTSPGGTTEAALEALEAGDFRTLVATALRRAEARSRELADRFAQE